MGLNITAYRKLTKLDAPFNEDDEPVDPQTGETIEMDEYLQVCANPYFPGREQGLEDGALYTYAEDDEVFSCSYGDYTIWRESLAKLAGYPLVERDGREASHAAAAWNGEVSEGPFYELVNFTDNDGVIGPVVAAKLLRDFAEFDERAKAITEDDFYDRYRAMHRGLELAADGGALAFQ